VVVFADRGEVCAALNHLAGPGQRGIALQVKVGKATIH
jgi:hypothetical protein